ncbi:secretory pathway protein Sec39 [Colletotrichum sublineola]|uniref:Putative secretory pathway protein Sec39 n=1 Tax=Colletotrichum sublineola TaxID=1173701 RepID=A0A066XUP8_COLSU|nr:secretory pathway protein Sec39 [Colletotrichum sublineola]KDN69491.1 putative secretory pathway protein Sec39 [Colletotrichum sublineola]
MSLIISPPKLVLLAVHLAIHADLDSLAFLTSRHAAVLRKDLVLRILLTYLPETVPSSDYVPFLEELTNGEFADREAGDIDYTIAENISDEDAAKKVHKLHLLPLAWKDAPIEIDDDPMAIFLLRRAHRVDEEAGLLTQLPDLLGPFLQHAPRIRIWMVSTLLPLLRRNCEYYPTNSIPYTLAEFRSLSDGAAVDALLSQTGVRQEDHGFIGRDLRGMLVPWLHDDSRWKRVEEGDPSGETVSSPGWERFLEWLLAQSSSSWRVAVAAVEQWGGAVDVDLGDYDVVWISEEQQQYLDRRYARAIMGGAYLVPEATIEALEGAHQMLRKVMDLLGQDDMLSLREGADADALSPIAYLEGDSVLSHKNTAFMRDDLLKQSNPLTTPSKKSTHLLHALILSAFILTRAGLPCTIKTVGDLVFIQDERDQKAEVVKLIHAIAERALKNDDNFWTKARNEILWLRNWGITSPPNGQVMGVFAKVEPEVIEIEILKALLSSARYSLAKSLYEDAGVKPLPEQVVQETVLAAALNAYDNASNPNRTRGGLKKCDDIINAFPGTITSSLPERRRIDSLLKATHALSDYRLVLRQGEPFSPVVLRVHSDPVSIIGKVLEQNPKSYTRIHDLLDVGVNMVRAGLVDRSKRGVPAQVMEDEEACMGISKRRITAMCIETALKENDFETAYSYVVNRLSGQVNHSRTASRVQLHDDWSWRAALQAGQYIRTAQTVRPTHLGNASGNPNIRHLEQRIDCLATALRIAPPSQLQEILKTFRRCEEQLDSALKEEAAQEADLDAAAANLQSGMPGGFEGAPTAARPHIPSDPQQPRLSAGTSKATDDAPMSLFDLSRATARAASRNFAALSTLQQSAGGKTSVPAPAHPSSASVASSDGDPHDDQPRARKRDQLREAAMGTLTSGVGWLIGAPAPNPHQAPRNE